ncbi:carbohydrate kinase family protein [Rhizobium sp. CC-YZS058]|uniref:carbohydrate kinase family protein n=1 Tax=Rhizobium sp. CC-YZS058 TaxID=3042153 RepID=UPI002B056BB9|nr:carbohydrate kinase family protein [Rhizobium sp. CC-YZS058]MEA3534978.1 carbohydrate kinase family protein [Rhizobium sp. CC-YZS058]
MTGEGDSQAPASKTERAARRVLVIGGAHIDRRGRISGDTAIGSSNPGSWFEEAGGGGFNAARNLARLGRPEPDSADGAAESDRSIERLTLAPLEVAMVAPRGGDAEGEAVAAAAQAAGVEDCPFTFLDRRTPSYTAILERDGNLVVALADMALYTLFSPRRLQQRALRERIAAADLVLLDANLPSETLRAALQAAKAAGAITAAIAISPAKVERLVPHLQHLDWLFLNESEAAAVCGARADTAADWASRLAAAGLGGAVVTRGSREAVILSAAGWFAVTPPNLPELSDVTGAGDALAAGVLAGLLSGHQPGEALRLGVAAAGITVRSPFAVAPELSPARLAAQLAFVPMAVPLLPISPDRTL